MTEKPKFVKIYYFLAYPCNCQNNGARNLKFQFKINFYQFLVCIEVKISISQKWLFYVSLKAMIYCHI